MIAVLVRDQDRVEFLHIFAGQRQAARNFFRAQSGIDENTCIAGNDQNRIPRRAAAKNGKFHVKDVKTGLTTNKVEGKL